MIRCAIIDDESWSLDLLKSYIAKVSYFELAFATSNPLEALNLLAQQQVDLLFLDIQMPEMTGFQLIPLLNIKIPIIITSAYPEYAIDGYNFHVIDYLLKPIELDRFLKAVTKFNDLFSFEKKAPQKNGNRSGLNPFIFIKTDGRLCKINVADILYVEAKRDYISIHTVSENLISLDSLNNLENLLANNGFIRIHKSYLIAINKINFVEGNRVYIKDKSLPIGDTFKKMFIRTISMR